MGSQFLQSAGIILGLVAMGAAAVAWARGKYRETSAVVWRDNAEAQRQRGDRLEEEVGDLRVEVSQLKQTVAVLTEMVTGTNAIAELGTKIDARFDALQASIRGRN